MTGDVYEKHSDKWCVDCGHGDAAHDAAEIVEHEDGEVEIIEKDEHECFVCGEDCSGRYRNSSP